MSLVWTALATLVVLVAVYLLAASQFQGPDAND